MLSHFSYAMELSEMLYDEPKWNILYGDSKTGNNHFSACRYDRNEIPTTISMFSGFSHPIRLIKLLYDPTGCRKF